MTRRKLFFNLISADIKRLRKYIFSIIISVILLLTFCGTAGFIVSKNIYKENVYNAVKIAYYIPSQDKDFKYLSMAVNFLENLKSMNETANIIEVDSIDDGYALLDSNEVLFFVNVSEGFFDGVMNGTNPPLDIIVRDNTSLASYVSNQLFMSLTGYLGIAQAAIYSALDVARENNFNEEKYKYVYDASNIVFLERVFAKDEVIEEKEASSNGIYSLVEHYISVAVLLSLLFMSFILVPYMQGYDKGIRPKLKTYHISGIHFFTSNFICCIPALILAYLPCYLIISIIFKHINPIGILTVLPTIIGISFIIALIANISSNVFSGNMAILFITLVIVYIGGGIIPSSMLPHIIKQISVFTPGQYMISNLAFSLFG
ncbi:MAG: ABC transporter permease [Lachnospiraceae bacterium]|nr:ABC transporter permease [Lachnospiraceae bacterium]